MKNCAAAELRVSAFVRPGKLGSMN